MIKIPKRMYEENRKSLNAFVGCRHDCIYCKPSFQRQAKRQRKNCLLCYQYTPHFHPKRLLKAPPKTKGNEFIFFPSSGDLAWALPYEVRAHIDYAKKYSDRRFLIQTKNPRFFEFYDWPDNVILGITLETSDSIFIGSRYRFYHDISKAIEPLCRYINFISIKHPHKYVTIEPILQFTFVFANFIRNINPEVVYIGYDNHKCRLPEPSLQDTEELIDDLRLFTEVRVKSLRRAWWEKE